MSNIPADLPADFGSAFARLSGLSKLGVEDMKLMVLLESAGELLYAGIADGVELAEAKTLLHQNGREEMAHANRLKKAIEILTGEPYEIPSLSENPYGKPPPIGEVTTEITATGKFYYGEDYHQQYLEKNPGGYCNHGFCQVSYA